MIKFTPKQHQESQNLKYRATLGNTPSEFSMKFIMGYAAALRVHSTNKYGKMNILLN